MADTTSTTSFRADIAQLKAQMQAAGRAVNLATAEFKAATAGMDDWGASADGLQAKLAQLEKTLEAQKKMLAIREEELQKVIAAEGANSAAADRVRTALLNQQAQIARTEKDIRNYTTALESVQSGSDEAAGETEKYQTATEKLTATIEEQERQLQNLKDAYKNAKLSDNTEEAEEYEKAIKDLSGELAENKKKLKDADAAADQLDKSLDDVEASTEKASDGFTTMKGVLANLIAEGIKKTISALKDLANEAVDAYKEFDEGQDNLIKKTGATGEAAENLSKSYKKVSKSVRGSMSEIGSGMGEINTRFGFTGKSLEDATVKFKKFADLNDKDVADSVRLVSRAMEDGGIETGKYSEVLDLLTKAAQASGVEVDNLAESVAKYGAPMRALGFDTKESIALFAQWEKTGVNTEIAFSGMKKAISNWAKDGKDARVEFGKTLKEIEETPDIAAATTKAIEVFGAKAGPDLADAIKGGRFAYEDFLAVLEDSQGTVEATYEETQDGYDKVQLAIQSARAELGEFTGELVKKYQPQIEKGIKKTVEAFKDGVTFLINNKNTILTVIEAIATAFITYKMVDTVTSVFSAFQMLFTLMESGTGIVTALNAALGLNPYALLAAGIAAAGIALAKYTDDYKKSIEAEYGLSDAQKEVLSNAQALSDQYSKTNAARSQSIDEASAEFDYLQALKEEYNNLIDSNGSVKKGYEDRADFIIGRLAEAMGIEREEIEKQIEKNGQLGGSIEDLIEKKRAEAYLDASKDAYTEAIQKRQEAMNTYAQTLQANTEAEDAYKKSVEENGAALEQYEQMLLTGQSTGDDFYWKNYDLIKSQEALRNAVDETRQGLTDAESAYVGYSSTIQNWETLSQAAASGSSSAIQQALTNIQNNFVTAETGTQTSLQNQLNAFKQNYENMKTAVDTGMPGVTEAQVQQAKELVDAADKELQKLQAKAKEDAGKAGESYAAELGAKGARAEKSGKQLATSGEKGTKEGIKAASKSGTDTGNQYAKSVEGTAGKAKSAGTKIGKSSADSAKATGGQMNAAGQYTGIQWVDGVNSKDGSSKTAGKNLANSSKSGAETVSAKSSGENFSQGFINGIASKFSAAFEKAKALARKAVEGIKKGQQEGSPSKLTKKSGEFFTQGYILGIASQEKLLVKTVQNLVTGAVKTLALTSGNSFTEAGQNAATQFSEGMSKQLSYMVARAQYQNQQKITEFDSQITTLQTKKANATAKLQWESDRKVAKLKEKADKLKSGTEKKNLEKQIEEEKAAVKKRINISESQYDKLIKTQQKYKEDYTTASNQMLTEFQSAMQSYQTAAQQLIDSTINGIVETYNEQYNTLIGKQNQLIEKLKSARSLFEVSNAGVMTIGDLQQQTKEIKEYTAKLQKIKQSVSAELFDEIAAADMKTGSAFISRLLAMSTAELDAYNKAYTEKMQAAQKAGESIYKQDFAQISKEYKNNITEAFKTLPAQLQELGDQALKGFVNGLLKNTDYMNSNVKIFVNAMVDQFKKQLNIKSPSKVMYGLGSYTGEGFNDGLESWIGDVEKTAGKLSDAATESISGLKAEILRRIPQSPAQGATGAQAGTTSVTNNYNLTQNNSSPRPLTALETYQARRQQIAMVKALT